MSRRKQQKSRFQVEHLEARDMPSASGLPFDTRIIGAGAMISLAQDDSAVATAVRGIVTASLAMPPQVKEVEVSKVCFDAVVVTPEGHPPTIMCPDGGFVPLGQNVAFAKAGGTQQVGPPSIPRTPADPPPPPVNSEGSVNKQAIANLLDQK
jgi:hypothetical protein